MVERLNEELQFKKTEEWNLPRDPEGFLAWLARSGIPGDDDDARLKWYFENNVTAKLMPEELRAALGR